MNGPRSALACGLLLTGSLLSSPNAHAGAWTQDPGHWQVITTADYYRADSRFDNAGNRKSQPVYTKYELNPYIEYGLRDGLTAGASLFLQHLNDSSHTTSGLGDTELFLRQRLYDDGKYVFSVQPEVKLPSPEAYQSHTPSIGSEHMDAGVRALGGVNYTLLGLKHYADVEAAYRHRTGGPHDQFFLAATTGLYINSRLTLMPQVFQTLRAQGGGSSSFTESPRDDYDLTRLQFSAVYQLDSGRAVQAGLFDDVLGRNTGRGIGGLVAYWKDF